MKNTKKTWFLPLLIMCLIVIIGSVYVASLRPTEESLSDGDVRTQLENMYGATVENLIEKDGVYKAELTRSNGIYTAEVNALSGKVLSLNQLSQKETTSSKVLSTEEAKKLIAQTHTGEIESISLNNDEKSPVYHIEVVKDQALVVIQLDALSGNILSEETKKTTIENVLITKERALEIALEQLHGEVEYVTFEHTKDGGYYIVEIEQDNEDIDDVEAVFQIHAVTGQILSVEWDD